MTIIDNNKFRVPFSLSTRKRKPKSYYLLLLRESSLFLAR